MLAINLLITAFLATAEAKTKAPTTSCGSAGTVPAGFVFGEDRHYINIEDAKGPEGESFSLALGKGYAHWFDGEQELSVQVNNKDNVPKKIHIGIFASKADAQSRTGVPIALAKAPLPPHGNTGRADAQPCISPAAENGFYAISIVR